MPAKKKSFRVGRVTVFLRGRVWYLDYHENGKRHRPRVGANRDVARQLASQTNAQLETAAPTLLSFEPIAIRQLQKNWLEHHEFVLRSSVQTINRYRTATDHLLRFLAQARGSQLASQFRSCHAEEFVRFLRHLQVAPNGHANSKKRPLFDKGIRYILESCRAMFNYARKHRHLSPYAENPFSEIELERLPMDNIRPLHLFSADQEREFLRACDGWQFPVFLTLMLTGIRPGELTHLLLPDDLETAGSMLLVRNKSQLGWQVKTRNERDIPLIPVLVEVLLHSVGGRTTGPVFLRRRFTNGLLAPLSQMTAAQLQRELETRIAQYEIQLGRKLSRKESQRIASGIWRDAGALKKDRIRTEFMHLSRRIGTPWATAPKMLRHLFATCLQDANVDPLIRNQLMGHSPAGQHSGLGMTAVYTHTRPETARKQLEAALAERAATAVACEWLDLSAGDRSPK